MVNRVMEEGQNTVCRFPIGAGGIGIGDGSQSAALTRFGYRHRLCYIAEVTILT